MKFLGAGFPSLLSAGLRWRSGMGFKPDPRSTCWREGSSRSTGRNWRSSWNKTARPTEVAFRETVRSWCFAKWELDPCWNGDVKKEPERKPKGYQPVKGTPMVVICGDVSGGLVQKNRLNFARSVFCCRSGLPINYVQSGSQKVMRSGL